MSDSACKRMADLQRKADLRPRLSKQEAREPWTRKRKPIVAGQVRPGAWIYKSVSLQKA